MIIGQYKTKVGAKKRVAFPKKFREELGDEIIVTRGYEGCLVIVDRRKWAEITREIQGGSFIDKKIRDSSRFLLAGAHEISLDSQGRFVIPEGLYDYGEFDKEAVFVGLGNWVEVWSEDKWQNHEDYIKQHGSEVAQELSETINKQ